ncbi:MAG: hypothetical protein LUF04_05885 [Bacteroides sp.]|nr:hypothetical protein [Bacteroides sp.]
METENKKPDHEQCPMSEVDETLKDRVPIMPTSIERDPTFTEVQEAADEINVDENTRERG